MKSYDKTEMVIFYISWLFSVLNAFDLCRDGFIEISNQCYEKTISSKPTIYINDDFQLANDCPDGTFGLLEKVVTKSLLQSSFQFVNVFLLIIPKT